MRKPRILPFHDAGDGALTFDAAGNLLHGLGADAGVTYVTAQEFAGQTDPLSWAYWSSGGAGSRVIGDTIGPPIDTSTAAISNAASAVGTTIDNAISSVGQTVSDFENSVTGALSSVATLAVVGVVLYFLLSGKPNGNR